MSDQSERPPGGYEPSDPWAPPEHRVPLDKPPAARPPEPHQRPAGSVHDQPTAIGMPGSVPPPPVAPGGPAPAAPGPYGYPGVPPVQQGQIPQQPTAAYGDTGGGAAGYGYPSDPYQTAGHPGVAPGHPTAPVAPYAGYPGYGQNGWQQPANGMGVSALVLGILSVCLFCLYGITGIVLGTLAVIFGVIGKKRAERGEATNGGQAKAGFILGIIGIVIGLVFIALIAWGITQSINDYESDPYDNYSTSLVLGS